MSLPLGIIAGLAAVALLIVLWRRRSGAPDQVVSGEIPEILAQLQASGTEGNASMLRFAPKGGAGDVLTIQYSIVQGVVGLDWVLLGFRNVADKPRIAELATTLGYPVEECELNHVRCLRMTGPGLSDLGVAIIRDFYNVSPETKIQMSTRGFKWNPHGHWHQV